MATACGDDGDSGGSSTPDPDKVETGQGAESSKPAPEAVVIAVPKDTDTFDPQTTLAEDGAQQLMLFLYDTLLRRDLEGKILPGIAASWDVTPTKGVFTIKDALTCSDGTPLDAAAVAASFERFATSPATRGKTRIFGAAGKKSITSDPVAKTVTIELNSPNNDLVTGVANAAPIICPAGLADPDSLSNTQASGSGPYVLQPGFKKNEQYVLERRNDYTNLPEGTAITDIPKTVTMRVIEKDQTAADFVSATANSIAGILSTDATRLQDEGKLVSVPAQAYGTNAVLFAQGEGSKLADIKLRQGVAMLIDSEQGGAAETQGLGVPRRTLYTPNIDCYDEAAEKYAPAYDPAAAATFLDTAGYVKGADGFRTKPDGSAMVINVVGDTTQFKAPDYLAQALKDGGFNVNLKVGTRAESIQALLTGQFDLGSYPYISSTPLPALWLNQIGSTGGDNFGVVNNTDFDTSAAAAQAAADPTERCDLWQAAEKAVLESANVVPLDQPVKYWFGNGVTFDARYYKIDPFSIRSA